jgi:hypothetical protein
LGEAFCRAKQTMADTRPDDPNRQLLDALASAVSPMRDRLAEERHEHLALFNLLGDPLLTIHRQTGIPLDVPDQIIAGEALTVRGRSKISGSGIVEVVSRRDRLKNNVTARRHFRWSDEFLRSMDAAYQQANDRVWLRKPFEANGEPFALRVDLPPETRGPCYVRVWIENSDGAAQGATRVFVHPAPAVVGAE